MSRYLPHHLAGEAVWTACCNGKQEASDYWMQLRSRSRAFWQLRGQATLDQAGE